MRKYLILLFVFVILAGCSKDNSTTPNNETPTFSAVAENVPTGSYKFDIKTHWANKLEVTGAKNGLKSYLKSNYCTWCSGLSEFTDDYTVWIDNITRTPNGTEYQIKLDLELWESKILGDIFLKKTTLQINYDISESWEGQSGQPNSDEVAARFSKWAFKLKLANKLYPVLNNLLAKYCKGSGFAGQVVYNFINSFLSTFMNDLNSLLTSEENMKIQNYEAVVAGGVCYAQLQEWIWKLEQ